MKRNARCSGHSLRPRFPSDGATITPIRPGWTALESVLFQHYLAAGHVLATGTNRSNLSRHVFSWQRDSANGRSALVGGLDGWGDTIGGALERGDVDALH